MCCALTIAGVNSMTRKKINRRIISSRHCGECSDDAIQFTFGDLVGLLRFARNDEGLVEIGPKPALRLLNRDSAPSRIIFQLVATDPRHSEILAVAVAEVKARDGGGRKHREILGQRDFTRMAA